MRRRYWALILVLLLTACGRGQGQPNDPEPKPEPIPAPAPAPTPAPQEPAAEPAPASLLLPREGVYTFYLTEGFGGQSRPVEEEWVREGNRLHATQGGGRPYVTWLLEPDGVWRADPQNPKVLLRYLPPELQDGMAWRQQSGSDWVYFRLRTAPTSNQEWVLTVINRGERTDWRFSNGAHQVAAEAPDRLADAFWKAELPNPPAPIPAERKAAIVAAATPLPTAKAAVERVSQGLIHTAMQKLRYKAEMVDLNGDGHSEAIVAAWDRPTWFAPELLSEEEYVVAEAPFTGTSELFLANLGGRPRIVALTYAFGGSLRIAWFDWQNENWAPRLATDLGPKLIGWTPATRAEALSDGRLRIEWEPKRDPAEHRQVRHLRLTEDGHVEWLDEVWGPRAANLRDPESPEELLQAFFFTQWFGLQDEAKRYVARPEMAASFPVSGQPVAFGRNGEAGIGRVEGHCEVVKQEPPASGPIPFYASIGQYEGALVQTGTAQVAKAADGRWVIESLEIRDTCDTY